jgi:hypothetical protein
LTDLEYGAAATMTPEEGGGFTSTEKPPPSLGQGMTEFMKFTSAAATVGKSQAPVGSGRRLPRTAPFLGAPRGAGERCGRDGGQRERGGGGRQGQGLHGRRGGTPGWPCC